MVRSSTSTCPIWGTPAAGPLGDTDYGRRLTYQSPRAGGRFTLTAISGQWLERLSGRERASLSTWIAERNKAGLEAEITLEFLNNILIILRNLSVSERSDNLLRFLSQQSSTLGYEIDLTESDTRPHLRFQAEMVSECQSSDELDFLLAGLRETYLVASRSGSFRYDLVITLRGHARLQELEQVNAESSQAFVAMWFDPSMNATYVDAIEPGISDAGYRPLRIDNKEHNNKIDDEIIAEIRRSRFVVCDFTSEPDKPRGGVYFEAGFAKGLGIEVIWTCRKDLINHVHFDTRQFSHIVWETPVDLRRQLALRIRATIGQGPLSAAARP